MKRRTCVLVLLAVMGALTASAAPPESEAEPADAVRLSLSESLVKALENNLDLAVAKKNPDVAWNDVLFQKAAFDPFFSAGISHGENKSELQPAFVGGSVLYVSPKTKTDEVFASIAEHFNFGATLDATLSSNRSNSTPSFLNAYNPQYGSSLSLRFVLPLLKGFGREVNEFQLLVAKKNLEISHEELRRNATDTLRSVEDAYWDLLAARAAQKVAEQALSLSQDLYDLNKKKVEVGTLAPIEITQAEANVASNVEGVITTRTLVKNAEDNLRHLLAIPEADPMWGKVIVPTEEPIADQRTTDLDAAIAKALEARPEVIQARMQRENAELGERVAKKNTRHGLDFTALVVPSGNNLVRTSVPGPDGIPFTPDDYITGGVGEGLSEIPKFNNYNWSVGLTYSVPIGNRAAEATYANARIAMDQSVLSEKNTQDLIRVDVRRTVRAVESGYERVVAARKNVELQTKKLDAERKKFDNGMSTSFEVFTFQNDLTSAQLSLIRAMLDYNKALADLERAKGTLLESKGLTIAADAGR
ncbi:MAG TPA: TolC family protein [Candidatus Polarisedimenticolaceae bacterium]|nr:TolC family protein [Candidatus Polarisedimenticolaceae bacterium]